MVRREFKQISVKYQLSQQASKWFPERIRAFIAKKKRHKIQKDNEPNGHDWRSEE